MSPKEKKFESPRKRGIRWTGTLVILAAGIVLIAVGTKTMHKVYNFEGPAPKAEKAANKGQEDEGPPPELAELIKGMTDPNANAAEGADEGSADSESGRSSEDIAKEFANPGGKTPERSSEDIAKEFGGGGAASQSSEDIAKQFGGGSEGKPAKKVEKAERPFTMISDVQLTIDTTFSGVILEDGKLVSQYDRSDTQAKRACPT